MKSFLLGTLFLLRRRLCFWQSLPVKEKVWENTVYDDDGTPSVRFLNCVTQQTFAEAIAKANTQPGCKVAGQNITGHGITMIFPAAARTLRRVYTSSRTRLFRKDPGYHNNEDDLQGQIERLDHQVEQSLCQIRLRKAQAWRSPSDH